MKEELRATGLTEGEIAVFLALLKLGQSTNSPIARHSGLQSSTVYYCLNSLIEKGFVTYIQRGGRKYFIPIDPQNILSVFDDKTQQLAEQRKRVESILPQLKMAYQSLHESTIAEVYEGWRGFQLLFSNIRETLKRGETYEAFVIEQSFSEPIEMRLTFQKHNKLLKAKGIKLRLLAHKQMRPLFEKFYGEKFLATFQEIRYAREATPVGITIYRNNVVTHILDNGKPMSFLVRNVKLAETYRNYFYSVWERAKP